MNSKTALLSVAVLGGWLSFDANAQLCGRAYPGCGPCGAFGQAGQTQGGIYCVPCSNFCKIFRVARADGTVEEKVQTVTLDSTPPDHEVTVPGSLVREVAEVNPWAASVLLTLKNNGSIVPISAGVAEMFASANVSTVELQLANAPEGFITSAADPIPDGVRARTSWRLERFAERDSELILEAYAVDAEERKMYIVYPSIVVSFREATGSAELRGHEKFGVMTQPARHFLATGWSRSGT